MEPCVYIMASWSRVLYVGVTRNLRRRWDEHHWGIGSEFVVKYRVLRLVHVEPTDRLIDALRREHQLKGWRRAKKLALIETSNPGWDDLARGWGWRITQGDSQPENEKA